MKQFTLVRSVAGLFVAATVLSATTTARAAVFDNAGIFSSDAVDQANTAMSAMLKAHNKTLDVETFKAVPSDQQSQVATDKARFFHDWMVKQAVAHKANGVFALVCLDPRFVEVGVGHGTQQSGDFTTADVNRVRDDMQQAFHAGNYDQGLKAATDDVNRAFTANINGSGGAKSGDVAPMAAPASNVNGTSQSNMPADGGTSTSSSSSSAAPASTGSGFGFGKLGIGALVCVGVAILLIISLVRSLFHRNTGGGYAVPPRGGNYPAGGPGYGNSGPGNPGYGAGGASGGGGFGRGILGGLLGGAVGGYAADKFEHRNEPGGGAAGGAAGGGAPTFPESGGGGGSSFDPGPSDAGQGFGDMSSGGDFGGGGGGDTGGGGGDSSGGGF